MAKRLPCVIMIPAGETEHHGEHSHDRGAKCFHHCEIRCVLQLANGLRQYTHRLLTTDARIVDTSARSL